MVLGSLACQLSLQALAYLWPAYQCFKDLNAPNVSPERLRLWAVYWVMLACFSALQPVADMFIFWLPMYYEAKVALCVYLWYPELRGAEQLYERYFKPFVARHEPLVDAKVEEGRALLGAALSRGAMRLLATLQARALGALLALQAAAAAQAEALKTDQLRSHSSRSLCAPGDERGSSSRSLLAGGGSSRALGSWATARGRSSRDLDGSPDRRGSRDSSASPDRRGGSPSRSASARVSFKELATGSSSPTRRQASSTGDRGLSTPVSKPAMADLKTHPIYSTSSLKDD